MTISLARVVDCSLRGSSRGSASHDLRSNVCTIGEHCGDTRELHMIFITSSMMVASIVNELPVPLWVSSVL
eukprot:5243806-Amphidinium_carterae.1